MILESLSPSDPVLEVALLEDTLLLVTVFEGVVGCSMSLVVLPWSNIHISILVGEHSMTVPDTVCIQTLVNIALWELVPALSALLVIDPHSLVHSSRGVGIGTSAMLLVVVVLSLIGLTIGILVGSPSVSSVHVIVSVIVLSIGESVGSLTVTRVHVPPTDIGVPILVEVGSLTVLLVMGERAIVLVSIGVC